MGHPNSKKHKAQHGGYRVKPSRKEVNALMGLYAGISNIVIKQAPVKKQAGVQLKLDF
jgi:hypothetical protein